MQTRKNLIDEESKKRTQLASLDKILIHVLNSHQTRELQLVSQFQGMESLKGHEKKLILEKRTFDSLYKQIEVVNNHPYREVFYKMDESLYLTDLELKNLIIDLEELKRNNPSILINNFTFQKKKIDDQEKYEVNFSFIIREKIENTA